MEPELHHHITYLPSPVEEAVVEILTTEDAIRHARAVLNREQLFVMLVIYFGGCTQPEVAERLPGYTTNRVKTTLDTATRRMRKTLGVAA
ncbi:MAG: hypothetical protein AAGD35_08650 [Actinomycetota bacterium]